MRRIGVLLIAVAMLMVGCSGEDSVAATSAPPATSSTMTSTSIGGNDTTTSTVGSGDTTITEPTSTTVAASTTTTTETAEVFLAGLDRIDLTTAAQGGGIRPELAWEPLQGADYYVVYLYAPDGAVYWSWQGRETSVPVGGRPVLPETASGPSVVDGMTWAVVAYDADRLPVGSSVLAPIGP